MSDPEEVYVMGKLQPSIKWERFGKVVIVNTDYEPEHTEQYLQSKETSKVS